MKSGELMRKTKVLGDPGVLEQKEVSGQSRVFPRKRLGSAGV